MTNYEERLNCSVHGDNNYPLFTASGLQIATGYQRVEIGERGPYVEFLQSQLLSSAYYINPNEDHRIGDPKYYYVEYRTDDICNLKIYHQQREVSCAGYIVGRYYISPFDLYDQLGNVLIVPLRKRKHKE